MKQNLIAACLQTSAGPVIEDNLASIAPMIAEARNMGADLIVLPETCDFRTGDRAKQFSTARDEDSHPAITFFSNAARQQGAWILAGSLIIKTTHDRLANRSFLFAPDGGIAARYDKIHRFDADLGKDAVYHESASFQAGDKAVLAETPWGKIGLTICYDVRFAALYRTLAQAGANIITVPAAFTVPTGKLHWHVLLRARAIETGCFILAPGQCGEHDGGRKTYGHSLIIAPSGEILAEAGETPGIIAAKLDLEQVADARRMVPSLQHDREFRLQS